LHFVLQNVPNGASIFLQAREYLSKLGDLSQTLIFAKIENVEVIPSSSVPLKDTPSTILS
jgi:pyruvate kinase